jgi:AraC-like DNA-binding protein
MYEAALHAALIAYDRGWVLAAFTGLLIAWQGGSVGGEVWIGYQAGAPRRARRSARGRRPCADCLGPRTQNATHPRRAGLIAANPASGQEASVSISPVPEGKQCTTGVTPSSQWPSVCEAAAAPSQTADPTYSAATSTRTHLPIMAMTSSDVHDEGARMIERVFRTEDVPEADRFEHWRECMGKLVCPMEMTRDGDGEYRAESRLIKLDALSIWPGYMQPHLWRRTPKLIQHSDPESYHLSLLHRGTVSIAQAGQEGVHGPYEMYVVDTSLPFTGRVSHTPVEGVGLEIPKALLPLPLNQVGRLVTKALPARDGVGALLAGFLTRLARDSESYRPADEHRLQTVLIELFTATLAHHLDAEDALPPETHRRSLTLRIQAFIQQHLDDPDLTPSGIAAAHHISTSHLHNLFRGQDLTISTWIRHQRLERARIDLADPYQLSVPIHHIAARWGFTHPAVFSRAFRAAYGLPPRDHRQQSVGIATETHRQ